MDEMIDFSECKFIRDEMQYYTYYDFCDNCSAIKRLYKSLSSNAKLFYRWYVYANIHMDLQYKNAIWDYLNFDEPEYRSTLMDFKKKYKVITIK